MEPFTAGLISLEDAQQKMLQQLQPISDCLSVALADAAGRITAKPVISPLDVPPFDNSAMDGYAPQCLLNLNLEEKSHCLHLLSN